MSSVDSLDDSLSWLWEDSCQELRELKLEILQSGREVIDLSMINPDLSPPRILVDKLVEAAVNPRYHRYAVSRGIRKLRESFAEKYRQAFQVSLDPDREICVTMGAKDATIHVLRCLALKGARALVGAPVYPAHLAALRLAGFEVEYIELSADINVLARRLRDKLAGADFRVILLNFPNNPTGIAFEQSELALLLEPLRSSTSYLINDFTYGELGYSDFQPPSILSNRHDKKRMLEIYSMSKAYSIPGWRVGCVCGEREVIDVLSRLKAHVDYGTFLPLQMAAAFALSSEPSPARSIQRSYEGRARFLSAGLNRLGFESVLPKAGASLWVHGVQSLTGLSSMKFCELLLREYGVLVLPGEAFGDRYQDALRFALVQPEERLQEVLGRIEIFLDGVSDQDASLTVTHEAQ